MIAKAIFSVMNYLLSSFKGFTRLESIRSIYSVLDLLGALTA